MSKRVFHAFVWTTLDSYGRRIEVLAEGLEEAEHLIKQEHGADVAYSLWCDVDAEKSR